jgi:hypothetical protein
MKDSILWAVMKSSHVERCDGYLWGGGDNRKMNFYETLTLSHPLSHQTTRHYVSEDSNIPSLFFFKCHHTIFSLDLTKMYQTMSLLYPYILANILYN